MSRVTTGLSPMLYLGIGFVAVQSVIVIGEVVHFSPLGGPTTGVLVGSAAVIVFWAGYMAGRGRSIETEIEALEDLTRLTKVHGETMRELRRRNELESVLTVVEERVDGMEVDWRAVAELPPEVIDE